MQKITTVDELRGTILLLEIKQANEKALLNEQFETTLENLKPANLIKNTLKDLNSSPDFKGGLLNTALSIGAGYLSKKVTVGSSGGPLKQVLGSLIQMGVTTLVSKNADGIKSKTMSVISNLFRKKEPSS